MGGVRQEEYRRTLASMKSAGVDWVPFLLEESRLPGPRSNLELAQAVADEGDRETFLKILSLSPSSAEDPRAEFLAACGAIGLGRLAAEGEASAIDRLRRLSCDPRWRVREGVAMGLQRVGDADMARLLDEVESWCEGGLLEQRAAAAALCEPRLLAKPEHARRTLDILDRITAGFARVSDRRTQEFRVLSRGMSYCWSVAVAALPIDGKGLIEKWAATPDPDVRRLIRENLKKGRLRKMDADWVKRTLDRLTGTR